MKERTSIQFAVKLLNSREAPGLKENFSISAVDVSYKVALDTVLVVICQERLISTVLSEVLDPKEDAACNIQAASSLG
ncbi:hypothetical protein ACQKGI_10830 [Peribacillus muralis]|uniref:hypothetical protein n=1 Tax=Peribacillus muralis TaxID=264697 RepID=UPI0037F83377